MTLHRRLATLSLVLALPFAVVACNTAADDVEDTEEALEETPAPAAEPAAATADMQAVTAQLTPLNESGVMGEIEVDDQGDQQSTVRVSLTGSTAGAVHQGMIHSGTCDNIGGVVAPLDPITIGDDGTGEVTTTVSVPMMTVANGSHSVVYHEANGSPGAPVTCTAIPMHAM